MTDTDFVDIIGYEGIYQINRNGDVRKKGSEAFLTSCEGGRWLCSYILIY